MQLSNLDRARYKKIRRRVGSAVQPILDDLASAPPGYTLLHCEGSGYQLERVGKSPLKLRGAHRILQECFWSEHRFGGKSTGKRVTRFQDGRTYYGSAGGLARGKHVHSQVGDFVMLPRKQYMARYPKVDPMTMAVLDCLNRHGYRGIHAEYMVYDERHCLGTAVDLVCLDRKNRLVFVEIKTGYHDAFLDGKKDACMAGPFCRVIDNPLNRARTQLLYAQALYVQTHSITPLGCVIHVDRDGQAVLFDMGPFASTARCARALLLQVSIKGKLIGKKRKRGASSSSNHSRKRRKSH